MKRAPLLICVLTLSTFLLSQSIWKEPKNPSWKQATGAEQFERLMWKAVRDKDWLAVESHMASNFVFLDSAGPKDKAQRVAELKALATVEVELKDVAVTPSGNHAIVTYSLGNQRIMAIWQEQKSGWVQVAMAVTAK